jgi:hypothetical protein
MAAARGSFGRERAAVAAHHSEGMREKARDVVLAHREPHHPHVAIAALE